MTTLRKAISLGEDSTRQFKADVRNAESLASELAAFANSEGGVLYIGVADDGSIPGLSKADVARINQLISNAASHLVRSPITVHTRNIAQKTGRVVIELTVPKGIDKPYFDKNGVIWLKVGSDKRRVNTKEELRRFFQLTAQFHADELPTKAGLQALDKLRFRDFLKSVYQLEFPDSPEELHRLLLNLDLATPDGNLNLAGVLLFAERPEWIQPAFVIKAIRYPGTEIHASDYVDTEEFAGPFRKVYDDCLAFVMRNLRKGQAGKGVNSRGTAEISVAVFEELIVNALVHRDYLVSASIRIFIFDDRIEIHSPGHLPNSLTVERIRSGISNIRNPVLASFIAKGILPYKGLGSGIKRALAEWPHIEFIDDRESCLFTAVVHRKFGETAESSEKTRDKLGEVPESSEKIRDKFGETAESSEKTDDKILGLVRNNPQITISELADTLRLSTRAIEKQIKALQVRKSLKRIGPDRGGHWELL